MSDRYARQMRLPEVGEAGQARIAAARVLVVGAGGLGCPVLQYLAGGGRGPAHGRRPRHGRGEQPAPPAALPHGRSRPAEGRGGGATRCAALNPGVAVEARVERLDAGQCARSGGGGRHRRRRRRQLRRHLHAERRLPCGGQAAWSPPRCSGLTGYAGVFCARRRRACARSSPTCRSRRPPAPRRACWAPPSAWWARCRRRWRWRCPGHAALAARPPDDAGHEALDLRRISISGARLSPKPATTRPSSPSRRSPRATSWSSCVRRTRRRVRRRPAQSACCRISSPDWSGSVPREARIVLCCRTGLRSWRAASTLRRKGFRDLALLAAG